MVIDGDDHDVLNDDELRLTHARLVLSRLARQYQQSLLDIAVRLVRSA